LFAKLALFIFLFDAIWREQEMGRKMEMPREKEMERWGDGDS
jgi:hypothetical protein